MEFKGKLTNAIRTFENDYILEIKANAEQINEEELNKALNGNLDLKIIIKQWKEQRSINANAYAWVLLDKIAQKIKSTKEEVYKSIIKKVGVFEMLPIRKDAIRIFIQRWQSKGLGWLCEVERESTIPNYSVVVAYYGTSTYNTEEMSRFIDEIVVEAENLGISTATPNQIAEMKSLWSEYEKYNTK